MVTAEQRQAFQEALAAELSTAGRKAIAARLEVTRSMVSGWSKGGEGPPRPEQVFAIEDELGLPPGTLSRHLGYVPVGSSSVLAAITVDETLTPKQRRALEVMFRTVISLASS